MKILLAIGAGSFIGGTCRYLLSQFIQARSTIPFPFATLTVNIIGCLLIGVVFGLGAKGGITPDWRLFLATGILGGFTTFSAFSYETVHMLQNGQVSSAIAYVLASVLLGLLATFVGIWLVKLA
ncbi:fluoride efflux transporter CrcB [Pontibacter amylolyticus]|uniref:Fluoride-specific ion channel FluC n=1 Tax=Pontibacter amylolyticus TaxID=1424080 RepID=A0ABQ1W9U0_9BACT|nr:fluoride efflux transporter CrcB [Pontibacter amylolyticus]GGG20353.1 putative fluoride ion transporter CrcB [Pontibacter amylolyticus]